MKKGLQISLQALIFVEMAGNDPASELVEKYLFCYMLRLFF